MVGNEDKELLLGVGEEEARRERREAAEALLAGLLLVADEHAAEHGSEDEAEGREGVHAADGCGPQRARGGLVALRGSGVGARHGGHVRA